MHCQDLHSFDDCYLMTDRNKKKKTRSCFLAPVAAKVSGYDIANFLRFLMGLCKTQGYHWGHSSVSDTLLSILILFPQVGKTP